MERVSPRCPIVITVFFCQSWPRTIEVGVVNVGAFGRTSGSERGRVGFVFHTEVIKSLSRVM